MQLTYGLHLASQYPASHMYMEAPLLPDGPPDMKLDPLPELPPEPEPMQGKNVPLIAAGPGPAISIPPAQVHGDVALGGVGKEEAVEEPLC